MAEQSTNDSSLEIAHILVIDVVGYSKLLIEDQGAAVGSLNALVRGTPEFGAKWRDVLAQTRQSHIAHAVDQATLAILYVRSTDGRVVALAAQQIVTRALGIWGLYLIASSAGLPVGAALLCAAIGDPKNKWLCGIDGPIPVPKSAPEQWLA